MNTAQTHRAASCHVDIYSDEHILDPVPAYHKMLSLGPIIWLRATGMHAIFGYDALTASSRNHRVFRSGAGVSINDEVNKVLIGSTLHSAPPQHDATRAITFAPLSLKALKSVRASISVDVEKLADLVASQGSFDAAQGLAPYLPLTIVRDLAGLGEHGKANMLEWRAATFELMGDPGDRREIAVGRLKELRRFLDDPETLSGHSPDGWAKRATRRAGCPGAQQYHPRATVPSTRNVKFQSTLQKRCRQYFPGDGIVESCTCHILHLPSNFSRKSVNRWDGILHKALIAPKQVDDFIILRARAFTSKVRRAITRDVLQQANLLLI